MPSTDGTQDHDPTCRRTPPRAFDSDEEGEDTSTSGDDDEDDDDSMCDDDAKRQEGHGTDRSRSGSESGSDADDYLEVLYPEDMEVSTGISMDCELCYSDLDEPEDCD